jgi:hypothetical protein
MVDTIALLLFIESCFDDEGIGPSEEAWDVETLSYEQLHHSLGRPRSIIISDLRFMFEKTQREALIEERN